MIADQNNAGGLLAIGRSLASALCLGQRGHGAQGSKLTDLEAARKRCAELLRLLGDPGPYRYDVPEVVPALVLAFREALGVHGGFTLGNRYFTDRQRSEAFAWMVEKTK